MMIKFTCLLIVATIISSCTNDGLKTPKPKALLKLAYTKSSYLGIQEAAPYNFEYSNKAKFLIKNNYWSNIYYPELKAEISITYQPIKNNLKQLVQDAEKLTYKHTLKADNIEVFPYENSKKKVYARLFSLSGDVASPIQFQATDSIKHFLYGSLYFNTSPNYDSILPAINFVQKDIQQLIESLEWGD